jgi:putative FmdB family regulatory protein
MPLYEYRCKTCLATFEVIQKFSDARVETCRSCGGEAQRMFSAPAIQFKGTGWYITDYARKGKVDPESSPAPSAPSASTSSDGGSSTKPASGGEAAGAGSAPAASSTAASSTASSGAGSPSTTSGSDKK